MPVKVVQVVVVVVAGGGVVAAVPSHPGTTRDLQGERWAFGSRRLVRRWGNRNSPSTTTTTTVHDHPLSFTLTYLVHIKSTL